MFIELTNITKKIGKSVVLENINLRFDSGHIYGLAGINGSGKTMLMRLICGLILPTTGSVCVNGEFLGKDISFPRSVGVLIENPAFLPNYTGYKNLRLIADIQNKITDEEIEKTLSLVGLDPNDKRAYRKYSLGMKQRLGLACAFMGNPDVIILDEPINALDEAGVMLVNNILQEMKKTKLVIIACHDQDELNLLSDIVINIDAGIIKSIRQIKI